MLLDLQLPHVETKQNQPDERMIIFIDGSAVDSSLPFCRYAGGAGICGVTGCTLFSFQLPGIRQTINRAETTAFLLS